MGRRSDFRHLCSYSCRRERPLQGSRESEGCPKRFRRKYGAVINPASASFQNRLTWTVPLLRIITRSPDMNDDHRDRRGQPVGSRSSSSSPPLGLLEVGLTDSSPQSLPIRARHIR